MKKKDLIKTITTMIHDQTKDENGEFVKSDGEILDDIESLCQQENEEDDQAVFENELNEELRKEME